ncbi:MAG: hypothetical protein J6K04_01095 [Lachnospiraceae bacterium]|nr:hypothetical protein [Lachnospiraceae bacterium]
MTSRLQEDNNYGGRRKLPYAFTEQGTELGKEPKQERYNLSEVIVIRLTKNLAPKGKTELKLHRFLGTIFSDKLEVDEKKAITGSHCR